MYDEFEAGMSLSDHVKIEVFFGDKKTVLRVNPVGRFSPGGCTAFVSLKKDAVLALNTVEEFYEMLLNRIYFENLEVAFDLENYRLKDVLAYTKDLEVDDENSWWLNYFKSLEEDVSRFHAELISLTDKLSDLKAVVHQFHEASGEMCDFVDFTCCPEGEEEDVLREFFKENLSPESEIDNIMEQFEDGYFYGNSFAADEAVTIDFGNGSFEKKLTVTDVN
ncbi:MAG: hypothetical protein IJF87_03745 [Erysipelotrichaceae bacterium]|nr:hypothetical protein [Erysipelotrichaceae bacterium]